MTTTETIQTTTIEVGTILHASWGHEQTNATFYRVLKIANGFATISELEQVEESDGPQTMCGKAVPVPTQTSGKSIRRKIHNCQGDYLRPETYMFARPWNGKPARVSHYG